MKVGSSLEEVLNKTIKVLDESKKDIFSITEFTRQEYENIRNELEIIKEEINEVINDMGRQEKINKKARIKLMEVSRDFNKYKEKDIKKAYERAERTSIQIAVLREKEEQLKKRRKDLENKLINLKKNVEKAESLVSKVSVIKEFLSGEMDNIYEKYDDLQQKNNMAIRIIQAQEEERKRVARDIHDGPAQSIANLVFRVEFTQKLLNKDMEKARVELQELKNLIRHSMQDVRKIIYNLRPMSLDDLGLVPTLKRYVDNFIEQNEILIEFNVIGNRKRLPGIYEVTVFRLIQEALNNIFKHARASSGKVRLEYAKERINIFVSDDGIGFNIEEIDEEKYGLFSMQERCNLLGGSLDIKSKKNKGTIIKIRIPIKGSDSKSGNQGFSCG
ncbi:MAG TPA: sensor histidine kinase [Halanaerobiales bacterium]|nr:sensor histidine kinase [Halanaerobiales bacterium]